jgi:hypothetical protein
MKAKETDLNKKLDLSKIKVYKEMNQLKSWFNTQTSKVMQGFISGRE